jgi:3',5'-cyclic AMP phosphodiesterase CpdA
MSGVFSMPAKLMAISDLHINYESNRELLQRLRPSGDEDWLILAGDVADTVADIEWALGILVERFARVIWVPGNHDLWTPRHEKVGLNGEARYRLLVERCRQLGVTTPEDPYPVWRGDGEQVRIAPLFLLYDYSFRPPGLTAEQALDRAYEAGVVLTDEVLLHPDPYPTRSAWCHARVAETERRLAALPDTTPLVLVNHWPLHREPTRILEPAEVALWCGTERTGDWHLRFNVTTVVYGHLHIPRTTLIDGVRFEEVSLGYPADRSESWHPLHNRVDTGDPAAALRQILPVQK